MHDHENTTLSVLLVEDSVQVRHRLVTLFCESQHVRIVGEAGSIDETLYLLRTTRPDAVVLDLDLPDGSGLQLIRVLREQVPQCRIVVLTSHDLPELKLYCAGIGVPDYFNKALEFEKAAGRLDEIARAKASAAALPSMSEFCSGLEPGSEAYKK